MLDKELIKKLYYEEGFSFAKIGEKLGVSRQRIHQLLMKYHTLGGKRSKKNPLILAKGCSVCGGKASILSAVLKGEVKAFCKDCHIKLIKASRKTVSFICEVCGKEIKMQYYLNHLYTKKKICVNCRIWFKRTGGKKTRMRAFERKKECDKCGIPFTPSYPNKGWNLCERCYSKRRWLNPDYRKQHTLAVKNWIKNHPEEYKIIQRRASEKWREKNPEKIIQYSRTYAFKNKEHLKKRFHIYYAKNRDHYLELNRQAYIRRNLPLEILD